MHSACAVRSPGRPWRSLLPSSLGNQPLCSVSLSAARRCSPTRQEFTPQNRYPLFYMLSIFVKDMDKLGVAVSSRASRHVALLEAAPSASHAEVGSGSGE